MKTLSPSLSYGLGRSNDKGIYILAYLIDNLVKNKYIEIDSFYL